ncbi:hypothetical protein [Actinophytocola sp.]|uniref:hypothetical protein n=1 Tax=Actinophytocola sp. TaxID=1872138 RepID=UPI003D6A1B63
MHLKAHFLTMRHAAAAHWRALAKSGAAVDARVINTSSGAGLWGSVGQSNYSAAKGRHPRPDPGRGRRAGSLRG